MAVDREKTLRVTKKLTPIAMGNGDRAWNELQAAKLEDPAVVLIVASSSMLASVVKGSTAIAIFHVLGILVRLLRMAPLMDEEAAVRMLRLEWTRQHGPTPAFDDRDLSKS